jgi:cis-3-alkyl-4-acyloxetan-2-one decarboxylase
LEIGSWKLVLGISDFPMIDYPFAGHFLDLVGLRYHYLDEGAGEPIVMLHGNPTWSYYYRRLVSALRDSYRIIVPDHIGCGLSDKPDDSQYTYTLPRRVKDLQTLLHHLRIDRDVTLVLHDWGGIIGMAYASHRPERIKRLIVLNTAAFHLPTGKRLPWSLRVFRSPLLGPLLVRGLNAFCRGAATHCCTRRPMPPEIRKAYLAPYDSWKNRIGVLRFVQDIPLQPRDPSYALVSEIQKGLSRFREVPMLICWGEKDFVFDKDFLAEWMHRFPEAEVHRFPDAGHYVLEDATEEILDLVRSFLKRYPLK